MKILYLECAMGAAGDMLAAALMDLLDDPKKFVEELHALGIPKMVANLSDVSRNSICGKSFSVLIDGEEENEESHHGHSLHGIEHIVESLNTDDDIKRDILGVYNIIAEAESRVHGKSVSEIHFHEVGMIDAVADIAAVCLAMKKICADKIVVSPIHVGSGTVRCAHGILPVPAPATAEILKGVPIYGGEIKGELCTPTGAALLKYFAYEFGPMPMFVAEKTGYGMGKREFDAVNCVRAILGEAERSDEVLELRANIDDMTGEDIAYAAEIVLSSGALDVWTEAIGMKKGRPGTMLCVLCDSKKSEEMTSLIFKHTTTLGVREIKCSRRTLSRHTETVMTDVGTVRKKVSSGYGAVREKYEYSDIAKIAKEMNMSLSDVKKIIFSAEK